MSRLRSWAVMLLPLSLVVSAGCSDNRSSQREESPEVTLAKQQASAAIAKRQQQNDECIQKRDALTADFERLRVKGDPWAAVEIVKPCATMTNDPHLQRLVDAGEAAGYLRDAKDEKRALFDRILSLQTLSSSYAETFKGNERLLASLQLRQQKTEEAQRQAQASQKKREGVRLGMTDEEVLQSSWGKPQKINRTTTARGTREQWVYGGSYLYFENGRLTAIQN